MNDKLKSAESAIHFIQKEHERVLHGLHMEIERLQQKCSGILQDFFHAAYKLVILLQTEEVFLSYEKCFPFEIAKFFDLEMEIILPFQIEITFSI